LRLAWHQPSANFFSRVFTQQDSYRILIPGVHGKNYSREFSVEVVGNEFGYRQGTWPAKPIPGKVIWLFGDSFAFGWGVEARDTFAAKLNEHGFAVYNLAIPGDGLQQYYYRLRWAQTHLPKPDFILLAAYDNDFAYKPNTVFKNNWDKYLYRIRYALVTSQVGLLVKRISYHLGLAGFMARHLDSDANVRVAYGRDLSVHQKKYLDSAIGQLVLTRFDQFIEKAKSISQKCVVIRIVPGYANGLSWQDEAIRELGKPKETYDFTRLDQELGRICANHSTSYLKFSPKTDSETKADYYRYDLHLAPAGHAALADQLAEELRISLESQSNVKSA